MVDAERPIRRLFLYPKRKTMTATTRELVMEMVENSQIHSVF
jgi:hypothetical protein